MSLHVSKKAAHFTESVIREMTRLADRHGAINLAQGFPDFPTPERFKAAACAAIRRDVNQYAVTWGAPRLREAIARKVRAFSGIPVDPDTMVTVTCGSTEAMVGAHLATVDPGGEVIVFEPWYENYGPDAILSGARPRYVRLRPPDWSIDEAELRRAFNRRTRAIIVNTPHNPTGKVFTREELGLIAGLCQKWDTLAITDEIYEHILYDGRRHVSIATLDGMLDRTITISGLSKTYSVTGWRIGYAIAPPRITQALRKVHDFLTVGAPAPLQEAGAVALASPPSYYAGLLRDYTARREVMFEALTAAGIAPSRKPEGAYYVLCDISTFGLGDDVAFARHLVEKVGVAVVPGSSFFHREADGRKLVRFAYCKRLETLRAAGRKLLRLQK
jgi:aspartate/methionine/tyrosine aminotransferase